MGAEFASLMKVLSNKQLSKKQIYELMSSMDAEWDRKVHFNEFMEFWLVVFTQWLKQFKEFIQRVKRTIDLSFGSKFREYDNMSLPGPFSSLLMKTNLGENALQRSLQKFDQGPRGHGHQA